MPRGYYPEIIDNSGDVYGMVRQGVNDATAGLRTLGTGGLALAQQANERAYQQALLEARQEYLRREKEDQRAYEERQRQMRRAEGKEDQAAADRRRMELQAGSLGIDPNGMTDAELAYQVQQKGLEWEIAKANKLDRAQKERAYVTAGGTLDPSTLSDAVLSTAIGSAAQAAQNRQAAANEADQITIAKSQPGWASRSEAYGNKLLEREALITMAMAPMPDFNKDLSKQDEMRIAQAMAEDPIVIGMLSEKGITNGKARLQRLKEGNFRAAAEGLPLGFAERYWQAVKDNRSNLFDYLQNGKTNSGERLEYSAGVQSYLANLRSLDDRLKMVDAQIKDMENEGEGKEAVQYGKALRDQRARLMQEAHDRYVNQQKVPTPGPAAISKYPPPAATGTQGQGQQTAAAGGGNATPIPVTQAQSEPPIFGPIVPVAPNLLGRGAIAVGNAITLNPAKQITTIKGWSLPQTQMPGVPPSTPNIPNAYFLSPQEMQNLNLPIPVEDNLIPGITPTPMPMIILPKQP